MGTAVLEMPTRLDPPFVIGTLGALDASVSSDTTAIRRDDEKLIVQLIQVLDRQLLAFLDCRTAEECVAMRNAVWTHYVRASRALRDTVNNLVPENVLEILYASSHERIQNDIDQNRNVLFGDKVADQMEFTLWLVARMRVLAQHISAAGAPEDRDADLKLHSEFLLFMNWGQFHFDCVLAAMKFARHIREEVQEVICDGLRAWVNTSVIMEEALELRVPAIQQGQLPEGALPWDDEDQELLDSSMKDLDAKSEPTTGH